MQNEVRAALKPTVGGGDDTISRDNQQACPIEKNFGLVALSELSGSFVHVLARSQPVLRKRGFFACRRCTVRNTLQCTQCSKTSHVEEPFLHFTLGMPESSAERYKQAFTAVKVLPVSPVALIH